MKYERTESLVDSTVGELGGGKDTVRTCSLAAFGLGILMMRVSSRAYFDAYADAMVLCHVEFRGVL